MSTFALIRFGYSVFLPVYQILKGCINTDRCRCLDLLLQLWRYKMTGNLGDSTHRIVTGSNIYATRGQHMHSICMAGKLIYVPAKAAKEDKSRTPGVLLAC